MLIYKDIVTGDELLTDAYKKELKDDAFYYVPAEMRQYKSDGVDDSLIGGNKSAEGLDADDDVVDTDTTSKINVVHELRLVEVYFSDKKDYMARHLKKFLAAIKKRKIELGELPADDEAAQKEWTDKYQALVKKHILSEYKNLQFFAGESGDEEGHLVHVNFIDNKPVLILFKDGLKEEKQ